MYTDVHASTVVFISKEAPLTRETTMATAHQLYPPERLADMDRTELNAVERFALADAAETSHTTIYDGMTRHETILTAQRTCADITAEFGRRAVAALRQGDAARGEAFLRKTFPTTR
jgi:hypothetical protein